MPKKRMLVKRVLKDEKIGFVVTTQMKKELVLQAEKKEMSLAEYVRHVVKNDLKSKN